MKSAISLFLCFLLLLGLSSCTTSLQSDISQPPVQLINPVRKVESSDDFSTIVDMHAPEGAEDCSYAIISDHIAQIQFTYDKTEYTMRGAYIYDMETDDVSGVYGPFDDGKSTTIPLDYYSDHYTVLLQYTTDGGGLATWSFGSFRGSLHTPTLPETHQFESYVKQVLIGFLDNWHREPTSEGHLEILSGGQVYYPCMQGVYGMAWDGENMVTFDGAVNFAGLLEYEQLPTIPYCDDFHVSITGGGQLNVICLYDENLERLENLQDLDSFSQLESGTYYAEIVITEDGNYIPEAGETEYSGLSCVFELIVE